VNPLLVIALIIFLTIVAGIATIGDLGRGAWGKAFRLRS
jgi:hypothetical protein